MTSTKSDRRRDVDVSDDPYESAPTERMSRAELLQQSAAIAAEIAELAQCRQVVRMSRGTTMGRTDETDPSIERLATRGRSGAAPPSASRPAYDPQLMEITRYESGAKHLRIGALARIATALEVEAYVLLMPAARTPKRRPGRPRKTAGRR